MAKSKTKKTNTKQIDDDEQQMKGRQKPADDDDGFDLDVDEPEDAAEEPTDLEDAEGEATELEDPDAEATELDTDEPEADADDDGDDDAESKTASDDESDDDDEDSIDETPTSPPAKISKLAVALILLNWIAAPAFLYFAYMDHMVRVQFSYRSMLNYVQVHGLPLKSEEKHASLAIETRPLLVLTPEQLKEAFRSRNTGKSVKDEFAPYEETIDKRIPFRIRPSDMTKEILTDIFQGQPDQVATQEDEIKRVQDKLVGDIENAAKEAKDALAKKNEVEKRALLAKSSYTFSYDSLRTKKLEAELADAKGADLDAFVKKQVIRNVLFTMAPDSWKITQLEKDLQAANPADLDAMLDDALQRRMYYDILAPLNIFRPGESKNVELFMTENLAERSKYPLAKVKELMKQRLTAAMDDNYDPDVHLGKAYWNEASVPTEAMKRDGIERRRSISFILFTLSQVSVPTLGTKLYSNALERNQIVCGMHEFTNSTIYFARTQRVLEERTIRTVIADRQGYAVEMKDKPGQLTNTPAFAVEYDEEINRLIKIVHDIDAADKLLVDTKRQQDHLQKIYGQRAQQHKDTLDRLISVRQKTEKLIDELRERQDQLHGALVDLSEAAERNERLYKKIQDIELPLIAEEAARIEAAKTKKKGKK